MTRRAAGDFDTIISWSVETWGGHQDLSYFLDSWHSQFVAQPGTPQPARNWQRWSHPELDKIIEDIRKVGFDDPKGLELGREYVKIAVREMPTIPLMSYNVFTVMDTTYWTGYPTSRRPLHRPGSELGQLARHVRQAEAEELRRPGHGRRRMRFYARQYPWRSGFVQFLLVVFIGINLTYVITHATPIDPVEQSIAAVTSFGNTSPEAIGMMRQSLRELYGLTGGPLEQYRQFLAPHRRRRFRPVAVGLPDARVDADCARTAVDDRAARDGDPDHLGARQPARRPRRLLPEQDAA